METPLPFGWKPLHIDRYDDTTDPDEHIDLYTTQVNLCTNEDAILCRVFPTSLKGAALNWYTQLPAESIDSFGTLVRQFTAQYATSQPHHITLAALASLKKSDDEPLRTVVHEDQQAVEPELRQQLQAKICRNANLFAWSSADMPGIDANFICYRLAIHKEAKPVAQQKRKVGGERREAIITETQKLLNAGFIHEVHMSFITDHANQIGRNMEVYLDDMVVKTTLAEAHAADLAEVFSLIRKHNMRLNPEKCVFSVQGGKFLGFMITSRGIEANPEKCKAIIQMQSPQTVKEVQPFRRFKSFLTTPRILQRPNHQANLLLYLAVAEGAISAVIVQEHQKMQTPVYFISRVLQDTEKQYQMIKKLALTLVTAARRLQPYF
uniref:Retrovirus-related Pol polyprotein from transposon opus n=1 Tax=Cajanus cajan TaxID=3821 RepID=A0A151TWX0_CAJCA|nr:Retrovirus-related Pol polyprotein from transposon opus [Cajanus cajan]